MGGTVGRRDEAWPLQIDWEDVERLNNDASAGAKRELRREVPGRVQRLLGMEGGTRS